MSGSRICQNSGLKFSRSLAASATSQDLFYSVVVHCKINYDIWSAEVFASARASAETDALQNIFYSVVVIANLEKNTSTSVILGSDAELESWAHILSAHRKHLQADLLKVSHHGSNYGTYLDILHAIRPKYAVISVGENPYGHPENCALKFLEETCVCLFRTDRDGTCIFESDGVSWQYIS